MPDKESDKDFRQSLTFKFFNESLNVEFLKNKFEYIINSIKQSNEHLYKLEYRRYYYNIRGILNYCDITIEGIPMSENILIVHAIINKKQRLKTARVQCSLNDELKQIALKKFKIEIIDKIISICTVGLNELPNELKICILKYLDLVSLVKLAHSNRFWYYFIHNDDILWKHLFIRDFGSNDSKLETNLDWKTMYRNEYVRRELKKNSENQWKFRSLPPLQQFPMLPWPFGNHELINRPPIGLDPIPLPWFFRPALPNIPALAPPEIPRLLDPDDF